MVNTHSYVMLQGANWKHNNGFVEDTTERDQRRKFRVEKKLLEMENIQEKLNVEPLHDNYHDILEFAENYFNAHERSPEGTKSFFLSALYYYLSVVVVSLINAINVVCIPQER